MNHRDEILDFVKRFPGRDDDQTSAALAIKPRQSVNQICRRLEAVGLLERRAAPTGKIGNYVRSAGESDKAPVQSSSSRQSNRPLSVEPNVDVTQDWFWEGNVSDVLVEWLGLEGWSIISTADTRTRQRGIDIQANRNGSRMLVEVKGFPSDKYRDIRRADEIKPTNPTLQAQQWYSHAVLKALRLQGSDASAKIVLAFPDFAPYRRLFDETKSALLRLEIGIIFVNENKDVEAIGL